MYGPYNTSWRHSKAFTTVAPTMTTTAVKRSVSMTMCSIPPHRSIEDRPATVVEKIQALTRSEAFAERCDIFAAPGRQKSEGRKIAGRGGRTLCSQTIRVGSTFVMIAQYFDARTDQADRLFRLLHESDIMLRSGCPKRAKSGHSSLD